MKKMLLYLSIMFTILGCTSDRGKSFIAYEFSAENGNVSITYGKKLNEYYGTFDLIASDETVLVIRNDYTKFRNEVTDFRYIQYKGNDSKGIVSLIGIGKEFHVCIVNRAQWETIIDSVSSWSAPAKSRFITKT